MGRFYPWFRILRDDASEVSFPLDLVYMDDSQDEDLCVFTALIVPSDQWRRAFDLVRGFRRKLKQSDGIYMHKEFHATEFIRGKGQISDRVVPKGRRCQIFKDTLRLITDLPEVRLMNAVFPRKQDERAFERLLRQVNRRAETNNSQALLICDEGKQVAYTRICRRLAAMDDMPGHLEVGEAGGDPRNTPMERIIEDPFFKDSRQSYFIRLVDFCAFALLRHLKPTDPARKYGLDGAFLLLEPVLSRDVCPEDSRERDTIRP